MNAGPGIPCRPSEHEEPSMSDQHPLEQLLRDAKDKDDLNAAAKGAELRKAPELQERVQAQWVQSKASLIDEVERANAVLAKHALRERYAFRELPDSGLATLHAAIWHWVTPSFEVSSRGIRYYCDSFDCNR